MQPSSWFRQGHTYGVKMKTDFNPSQLPYLPLKNSKTELCPFSYQLGRFQGILVCFIMPVLLHERIRENRRAYMKKKLNNLPLKLSFFFFQSVACLVSSYGFPIWICKYLEGLHYPALH